MKEFTISKDKDYLKQDIQAYYNTTYTGRNNDGNSDYLNDLKNTYGKPDDSDSKKYKESELKKLKNAVKALKKVLEKDLPKILKKGKKDSLSVCVVPRSKAESSYTANQLLFKSTVQSVAKELDKFKDTSNYIVRTSNTKTTHLPENTPNYKNDGKDPYVGITKKTCTFDENIKGKDILLIDDIYTADVNIDEDAIQALLTKGAKSVTFYAVAACGI